ncbi:hypothetical protein DSO57_1034938 [Entomophthora muscae]|uniref:Uncharacterized protein n=1 Tax=Entomophthora muscae TaxID=34485 RepID=A0ACC2U9G7_9FUNG|nr:hypothetical protein DSO57_1034938 [Entomophthora muscae]
MIMDMLQEPTCPEILPTVLSAICFRMRPAKATLDSTVQSMESLTSRDSKLLLFSMTLMRHATKQAQPNPSSKSPVNPIQATPSTSPSYYHSQVDSNKFSL